ncbi:MAG: hypothetical protein LBM07_01395 [Culturomica sp.]|jgi:hypothetical protein|nr:hypothetical protein [Culturomica sp.]
MNILITNIGNRNIKYKGTLYSDLEKRDNRPNTSSTFREWTKALWENFDAEKESIQLNILDTVLKQYAFDKLIIIVSNQEDNPNFNKQDTLYEGKIIREIIRQEYAIEDVELKEMQGNVTDENSLLLFYQKLYADLLAQFKDADFVFCDAGGTGQQKTAAKIMAEFMLPDTQLKILYPKKDGSVEEKTQVEYKNVINKEQAISLIRKSQYEAALNILGYNANSISDNQTINLLAFAHFRINRVLERTRKLWDSKENLADRKNICIISAVNPCKRAFSEDLYKLFGEKEYLFLSESLLVAYRKLLLGNFRDSILDFAVFYEEFIDNSLKLIEKEIEKCIGKRKDRKEDILFKWINEDEHNCPITRKYAMDNCNKEKPYDYSSVPLAIHLIAEQDFFHELQPLANLLLPYLDFTYSPYKEKKQNAVREVRNKVAHEGKYVDKRTLAEELPYYQCLVEQCLDAWGLPREDMYEPLNKMIEEQIRSSAV